MTLNSALSQNWVGCTVRTPKTQVARTLRAQCPGRGRCCTHSKLVARLSRLQPAQVARIAPRPWAQVVTSFPCPVPGQVVTPKPGRDPSGDYPMSRHQFHVATSFLHTVGFPGRDAKNPGRDLPFAQPK